MKLIFICSEWCASCRNFKEVFKKIQWKNVEKFWVDVDSKALDDVEIEKVPTVLLISDDKKTSFFSELPTKVELLEFLVNHMNAGVFPAGHTGVGAEALAKKSWEKYAAKI